MRYFALLGYVIVNKMSEKNNHTKHLKRRACVLSNRILLLTKLYMSVIIPLSSTLKVSDYFLSV